MNVGAAGSTIRQPSRLALTARAARPSRRSSAMASSGGSAEIDAPADVCSKGVMIRCAVSPAPRSRVVVPRPTANMSPTTTELRGSRPKRALGSRRAEGRLWLHGFPPTQRRGGRARRECTRQACSTWLTTTLRPPRARVAPQPSSSSRAASWSDWSLPESPRTSSPPPSSRPTDRALSPSPPRRAWR